MILNLLLSALLLSAACAETEGSRRILMPTCDSDRPYSWATHRTLTLPPSCLLGSAMENAMADALCCVYTHVVIGSGSTNTAVLETYDGSSQAIGECGAGYASVQVMEETMDRVCRMSMGREDCSNQAVCVENAKLISSPSTAPTGARVFGPKATKTKKTGKAKKGKRAKRPKQ
mmetsp:Transcript_3829/g.10054  ORF Transcript_3829/g.10054 Transcript_3829/m.10054 type:complete len:174 (+) Transcript_3829:185-706(+)